MNYVGIDLAGVDTRPTGFCILKGMDAETGLLLGDEEIVDRAKEADPEVVEVDASLSSAWSTLLRNALSRKISLQEMRPRVEATRNQVLPDHDWTNAPPHEARHDA